MIAVYAFYCSADDKFYVGSSCNVDRRRKDHVRNLNCGRHHSNKFQQAWERFGKEAFEFKILQEVSDPDQLLSVEQTWIDRLDSFNSGYNALPKSKGASGFRHSEDSKLRISLSLKGRKQAPRSTEYRANIGAARRGKGAPWFLGKPKPAEVREKIRRGKLASSYRHSPEVKQMIADASKRMWESRRKGIAA